MSLPKITNIIDLQALVRDNEYCILINIIRESKPLKQLFVLNNGAYTRYIISSRIITKLAKGKCLCPATHQIILLEKLQDLIKDSS